MMGRVRRALLIALLLLAVLAAGGYWFYKSRTPGSVVGSSTVEFRPKAAPKAPRVRGVIDWPVFGFGFQRDHLGPSAPGRPPLRVVWRSGGRSLLEFPPVIGFGRLFISNADGNVLAVSATTGRRAWTFHEQRCVAASPALGRYAGGTVYAVFLGRQPCGQNHPDGEVVALGVGTGDVRWRTTIGPSETSPLLVGHRLYVGDWRGAVYELDARTGKVKWRFSTGGPVKGGIAFSNGRVFAGSYDGHVYCLRATDGHLLWRASEDARLFGHGTFYSTPAVAYGRVYIGSTDSRVYSYGATTGERRWSYVTGGYVYGSPSVWNGRVYIGSYDHNFYALDAATGRRVWSFHANGPISGSSTVLDGIVYFATLNGRTYALKTRNGSLVWSFPDGKYAPVVTDGRRIYLAGFAKLYALVSTRR
jgi:outer membrane protein assembly factor BamB